MQAPIEKGGYQRSDNVFKNILHNFAQHFLVCLVPYTFKSQPLNTAGI